MIGNLNDTKLEGFVTKKPELRKTQTGKSVTSICLAVDRDSPSKDAQKVTDFFYIDVWGKQAEVCCKYLDKGSRVIVEAELRTNNWLDDMGVMHYGIKIVAKNVRFGSPKKAGPAEAADQPEELPY